MANTNRVGGIDLARGVVLIAIMIDHVPGNGLEAATPRNYALCDSAEAFVFLSGVSVGVAYFRKSLTGLTSVARSCLRRAWHIYGVHLALTLCAVAIFGIGYWLSGSPSLIESQGRTAMFHEPMQAALGVAVLTHQLGYFNILPLYVVLMSISPLILALARIHTVLAVLVSGGGYAVVRLLDFNLPNWPEPGAWFLNPFAWQLIFTLGIAAAIRWRDGGPARSPTIWMLCALLAVASALIVNDAFGLAPGLRDRVFAALDVDKQDLGVARLANFLALAYLVATSPFLAKLGRSPIGEALQSLGRNSLKIFAASSVLSAIGQAGMAAWGPRVSERVAMTLGFAYTVGCIVGLFALARYLEWRKTPSKDGLLHERSGERQKDSGRWPRWAFARRASAQ